MPHTPIRTDDLSFERAGRAESKDTKIKLGTQMCAELWSHDVQKILRISGLIRSGFSPEISKNPGFGTRTPEKSGWIRSSGGH